MATKNLIINRVAGTSGHFFLSANIDNYGMCQC